MAQAASSASMTASAGEDAAPQRQQRAGAFSNTLSPPKVASAQTQEEFPQLPEEFLFDSEPEEPTAAAAAAAVAPSLRAPRQERLEAKVVAQAAQLEALADTVKKLVEENA